MREMALLHRPSETRTAPRILACLTDVHIRRIMLHTNLATFLSMGIVCHRLRTVQLETACAYWRTHFSDNTRTEVGDNKAWLKALSVRNGHALLHAAVLPWLAVANCSPWGQPSRQLSMAVEDVADFVDHVLMRQYLDEDRLARAIEPIIKHAADRTGARFADMGGEFWVADVLATEICSNWVRTRRNH